MQLSASLAGVMCCVLLSAACGGGANSGEVDPDDVGQGGEGGTGAHVPGGEGGSGAKVPGGEGGSGASTGSPVGGSNTPDGGTALLGDAGGAKPPIPPPDPNADPGGPKGARGLQAPAGMVGMFVASGNGGRTVISCDDGKTWIAQHKFSDTNNDHSEFTHKGFAHGNGKMAELIGWGAVSSVKYSEDGVTWLRKNVPNKENGTIVFDGVNFVIANGGGSSSATDPGGTWTGAGGTGHGTHARGGGGGPRGSMRGAAVAGGSNAVPVVTWNGGKSWAKANGCPAMDFYNLGQTGGAAMGLESLLIASTSGAACVVAGPGMMGEKVSLPTGARGKVDWLNDRFVIAAVTSLLFSANGRTWTTVKVLPTNMVNIQDVDVSDRGTFVGINRGSNTFYRSEDGANWQKITGPSGGTLIDLEWVHAKPSPQCPD